MAAKRRPYPGKPSGRGKGVLQRAVIAEGMSRRQAAFIVDTVIDAWKGALARGEEVELPIGTLKVVERKRRRRFQSKPNLKGVKRHLWDVNRQPRSVQLVKKKLEGEPTVPYHRWIEPEAKAVGNRIVRPVAIAHVSLSDLRRFR